MFLQKVIHNVRIRTISAGGPSERICKEKLAVFNEGGNNNTQTPCAEFSSASIPQVFLIYSTEDLHGFIFPCVTIRSHDFVEVTTSALAQDVRLDFVDIYATPFIKVTHDITKGNAVLIWLFDIVFPHITQDDVLGYFKLARVNRFAVFDLYYCTSFHIKEFP